MKFRLIFLAPRLQTKRKLVREVCPMMPAHDVAKYFVSLVDEEAGDSITNLKLQKLLYYAQGAHLALHDAPLFPERIEAWTHGPVVPDVYHRYKQHGSEPIPVEQIDLNAYNAQVREVLDEVNEVFGQFSALKLRAMTHNEPPWIKTPQGETIPLDLMKEFFKTMVIPDDVPAAAAAQG
jgi:uncharacterized phage-associated protein